MTETAIQPAPAELLALARAMRPDWDHDALAAAILAAKTAGWTWDHVLAETVRLMRDPAASPSDLRAAAAVLPPRPGTGRTPAWKTRAAEARERLLTRNDPQDGAA